ncbi:ankyrin repeat-containing protein At5g02620 isoform X1 [Rosa chinensis]|uniref:ankyrin repeat-containing protein At5g02620 isoform X1 n=1 Tax=Rosa chinensis TaxID=74649 RepID=UPI001AD941AF|nr:ankyrin repeat-containing protein At5g02620 isoform X1 [Rosa chinensis]XP_040362770.1 ankyrin repeat-containing protein At5g02620 isoform X1 [Rosa chinensis]
MSIPQAQHVSPSQIQLTTASSDSVTGIDNQSADNAIHISADHSAQPNRPSSYLLEHTNREESLKTRVALYKSALKGDWEAAELILKKDRGRLLRASISRGYDTVLHVAAGTSHIHFVEKLVSMMEVEDLALQDVNGNTALCIAASAGSLDIVQILIQKNKSLLKIRGGKGMAPAYMAAVLGQSQMACYLYRYRESKEMLEKTDRENLFFSCINNCLYDLAFQLLDTDKALAKARTSSQKNKTALHILARRPSAFGGSQSPPMWTRLINSFLPGLKFECKRKLREANGAFKLVHSLWEEILRDEHDNVMRLIKYPSNLLFDAAELGNYEFLAMLMSSYPELVWETNEKNRTIIHVAVLHRHASIFNLVHEIGSIKDVIVTYEDDQGNNIVHMAAKLAPQNQLNLESGVALQMHRELVWFEEVKKIVQPQYIEMENDEGKTPQELFTEEHMVLMAEGEKWMKDTATSCMLVATIIATVVFSAAFSIPGGTDDHTGKPKLLKQKAFLDFTIADEVALFSSSTAMLMFLFILTSRYAENDFRKSLPLKLMAGLTSLFVSIASMMMAFSTAFYLSCQYESKWVSNFTFLFAFVPIALFALMKFPLVSDMSSSIFCSSLLFQPWKHMLY